MLEKSLDYSASYSLIKNKRKTFDFKALQNIKKFYFNNYYYFIKKKLNFSNLTY
jgi:hypothetical protein